MTAEKPVECSQCQKSSQFLYKEIVGDSITTTLFCSDCPVLAQKLGKVSPSTPTCARCHTSFEAILRGEPMGCPECYTTFESLLIAEFSLRDQIPEAIMTQLQTKKDLSLYLGKSPGKAAPIAISTQMQALHESLKESLHNENYEQAAWLRDQIKKLEDTQGI